MISMPPFGGPESGGGVVKALARREELLEQRFVHEQTMEFRYEARRNKALVEWASSLMGMAAEQVDAYRDAILALSLRTGRDDAVVERISVDLAMAGAAVSQKQVRSQMDFFWAQAKQNPV